MLVARPVALVSKQETALPQVFVELAGQVLGATQVAGMLCEDPAHCLAERPLAGAEATEEDQRDFGWLVGMLDAPGQPTMDVAINVVVMRGQHLEDMFAEVRPLAELGLDAEPAPQIEAVIDDGFAPRSEDHAVI